MSGFTGLVPDLAALAGLGKSLASSVAPAVISVSASTPGLPDAASSGISMGEWTAILVVLLVGFLPTEMWRTLAVLAGRNVEEGSALFHWVKAVATALLAAVVARLVFAPTGALLAVPLAVRMVAIAGGVSAFLVFRRSVFAGVLAGEIILVGGAFFLAS